MHREPTIYVYTIWGTNRMVTGLNGSHIMEGQDIHSKWSQCLWMTSPDAPDLVLLLADQMQNRDKA